MELATLAEVSAALAATRSRKEKVRLIAHCLRRLAPEELQSAVGWLSGDLPGGKLGLGPAAIRALHGVPAAPRASLSVSATRQGLDHLRDIDGKGSGEKRREALAALFARATGAEQDFLVRLLLGDLRQGALEGVMAEAIAEAASVPADKVRRAIMLAGAIPPAAEAALSRGEAALEGFRLQLYQPLSPMLASPVTDTEAALDALGAAVFDYKIDGARAQIHKGPDGVKIYSRNGRDVTFSLPEIAAEAAALPARGLILDAEVIALRKSGRPRPFQDTMRRFGRKLGVEASQADIPLSLFCFDCLHADGEDLIDRPLTQRLEILSGLLPAHLLTPRLVTVDPALADRFLKDALAMGHEGIMAKDADSPYEAGSRGGSWLKIKQAHTLDLVVLAAEWGNGRRRGWLSNLHLGARDGENFVMLGRTFKGLTDETLEWQTKRLQELALEEQDEPHTLKVRPELVVEIAFNELQASTRYPGGLALRFARVLRYREDKSAAEVDSMETVRRIAGVNGAGQAS